MRIPVLYHVAQQEVAEALSDALRENGLDGWMDEDAMRPGMLGGTNSRNPRHSDTTEGGRNFMLGWRSTC